MPEPTHLFLLEDVHSAAIGTKVRFLGCVHAYNGQRARLTLRRSYPATSPDVPSVVVDVRNVLERVTRDLLEVGAWLNVVGYVGNVSTLDKEELVRSKQDAQQKTSNVMVVVATLLWSAGAIKLGPYDCAVQEYQKPLPAG